MDSVRRLSRTWLLGALLALFAMLQFAPGAGVPEAVAGTHHGVTYSCLTNSYNGKPAGCTREIAYAQCEEVAAWYRSPAGGNKTGAKCQLYDTLAGPIYSYEAWYQSGGAIRYFNAWVPCPEGTTWDEVSKKCFDPQQCLAKPPLGFTKVVAASSWDHVCSEGCQFTQAEAVDIQFPQDDGTVLGFTTGWKPNGQACLAGDPSPSPATSPQQCLPAPAGQTFCIKPNGDHCYSASTGRQICWRPGETGEKTDGNALQQRAAGNAAGAPPPSTPPPPGDSFTPQGSPHQVSESVNGTGITTVVINYGTTNGTNAGGSSPDQGENSNGTGGPSGGNTGSGGTGSGDAPEFDAPSVPDAPAMPWGTLPEEQTWDSGIPGNDSCPIPVSASFDFAGIHQEVNFDFDGLCLLADKLKPLVIALGFLAAGFIVAGVRK